METVNSAVDAAAMVFEKGFPNGDLKSNPNNAKKSKENERRRRRRKQKKKNKLSSQPKEDTDDSDSPDADGNSRDNSHPQQVSFSIFFDVSNL